VRVVKVDMESTKIDFVLDGIIEKSEREKPGHDQAPKAAKKTAAKKPAKAKKRHG